MLELTKTPPTERLVVSCPVGCKREVMDLLIAHGCEVREDSGCIAPEEVMDVSPAAALRGARYKEDMTQSDLSERTGIPRRHISDMENGRRPIGKQSARKIGAALNMNPRVFLEV